MNSDSASSDKEEYFLKNRKISNSLSLTAKEFVPSKILPTTSDNKIRVSHHSLSTSSMNNQQSQPFSPPGVNTSNILSTAESFPLEMIDVNGVAVDSAIVAALRDARERAALFRLEDALVEFMNECQSRSLGNAADESFHEYMDVGGPCFSVILKGDSNSPTKAPIITGSDTMYLRQSSFQRLVMHRLADRFGIVRTQSPLSTPNIPLMRLVKATSSSIPSPLISELDWSPFAKSNGPYNHNNSTNYSPNSTKNSYAQTQVNNNYVPIQAINNSCVPVNINTYNSPVQAINSNIPTQGSKSVSIQANNSCIPMQTNNRFVPMHAKESSIPLEANRDFPIHMTAPAPANNSVPPVPQDRTNQVEGESPNESIPLQSNVEGLTDSTIRTSNPKLMIMKRSVSSSGSKKQGSDTNLAGMDESGASNNKFKGKKMSDKEKAYLEARARILGESEVSMDPSDSAVFQDLDGIVPTMSASGTETPRSQSGDGVSPSPTPTPSESDTFNQGNDGAGLASKVLWRNRKQEECDPDFKRGVIPVMVVPATTNVYSVPIRGGPMSRMTPVTATTSATTYYPAVLLQSTTYSSTSIDFSSNSTSMRSAASPYIPSQTSYFGPSVQVGPVDIPNPNRSYQKNPEIHQQAESNLPSEIVVQSSANAADLTVPALDDALNRDMKTKEVSSPPGGKTYAINRRSGPSPWGMNEASTSNNIKEPTIPNQYSAGNNAFKDENGSKIRLYNDEDFPTLGG